MVIINPSNPIGQCLSEANLKDTTPNIPFCYCPSNLFYYHSATPPPFYHCLHLSAIASIVLPQPWLFIFPQIDEDKGSLGLPFYFGNRLQPNFDFKLGSDKRFEDTIR